MCLRKHTDWSCGHHTIRLSQCSDEPPDRGCLALFFGRSTCPAQDVFRIRDRRCPGCCESRDTRERRSAEREARRQEMRASYEAHRSSTESSRSSGSVSVRRSEAHRASGGRGIWEGVVPGSTRGVTAPEVARVRGHVRPPGDRIPPFPSSKERGLVFREASSRPTAGYQWDPVLPRAARSSRRVDGPCVRSPASIWDPVVPRGPAGRAEKWISVPLV